MSADASTTDAISLHLVDRYFLYTLFNLDVGAFKMYSANL